MTDWHMPLRDLCKRVQEFSKLLYFAKEFAKLQEAFETAALEKSAQPCLCSSLADQKKKKSPLSATHVLNYGRNRLLSSSSCPVNLIDRC